MSGEALYEQYKDALKRGHVATVRGRVDEALLAYAEAAQIAPERATPHASAGSALLRGKRPAEALRHYEVALKLAPLDEVALLGRAQALAALDRRGEAADAFDALAEVQASSGRLSEAVDAARRGLELAEGRDRRRTLERLIAKLRASQPDEPGRGALERALQVLEGVAVPRPVASAQAEPASAAARMPVAEDTTSAASQAGAAPGPERTPEPDPESMSTGQSGAEAPAPGVADTDHAAEAMPAPMAGLPQRELAPGVTAAELAARAEEAIEARLPSLAVDALLDLAAFHARDGRIDAALDACYAGVSLDPDNVTLHLAIARLYAERGWSSLSDEKLALLQRLGELDDNTTALSDIAAMRAALP